MTDRDEYIDKKGELWMIAMKLRAISELFSSIQSECTITAEGAYGLSRMLADVSTELIKISDTV